MRTLLLSSTYAILATFAFAASPAPRPSPPLEIVDSAGKRVLSNYKGKVVVIQFLLTTCQHCQAFSQILNQCQNDYGPRGFQALGGAANEATPQMAKDYATQFAPAFPVGPLPRETVLSYLGLSLMDRFGYPQIVVIDRKGRIREQTSTDMTVRQPLQDEAYLRRLIEKLLAEDSPHAVAVKRP